MEELSTKSIVALSIICGLVTVGPLETLLTWSAGFGVSSQTSSLVVGSPAVSGTLCEAVNDPPQSDSRTGFVGRVRDSRCFIKPYSGANLLGRASGAISGGQRPSLVGRARGPYSSYEGPGQPCRIGGSVCAGESDERSDQLERTASSSESYQRSYIMGGARSSSSADSGSYIMGGNGRSCLAYEGVSIMGGAGGPRTIYKGARRVG